MGRMGSVANMAWMAPAMGDVVRSGVLASEQMTGSHCLVLSGTETPYGIGAKLAIYHTRAVPLARELLPHLL